MRMALILTLLSLAACDMKQLKDDNHDYKLDNAELSISPNKDTPVYNQVFYAQTTDPHETIIRDFHITREDQILMISRHNPSFENCQKSGDANFKWELLRGNQIASLKPQQKFKTANDDWLRVTIKNPAACQVVRLQFVVEVTSL